MSRVGKNPIQLATEVLKKGYSVRQTEKLASKKILSKPKSNKEFSISSFSSCCSLPKLFRQLSQAYLPLFNSFVASSPH